jgi:hypothetical protein
MFFVRTIKDRFTDDYWKVLLHGASVHGIMTSSGSSATIEDESVDDPDGEIIMSFK